MTFYFGKLHNFRTQSSNSEKLRQISTLLDKDIVLLHQNPEHGPILLSWMLMNFQLIELRAETPEFQRFQQYGTKATKLGVFSYLHNMINHTMYRDQSLAALISCRTIYNLLSFMCEIFDSERAVAQHKHLFELLCELLKNPNIASLFYKTSEGGAQSLFNIAIENFPVDFVSLSMIAHSLTSTSASLAAFVSFLSFFSLISFIINIRRYFIQKTDFLWFSSGSQTN